MRSSQEILLFGSPIKKDNEVYQSRFFRHSSKKQQNPQAFHSFFHNNPFQKYNKDISLLRPVSNVLLNPQLLNRNYIIVDQQVTYGKPLSLEQINEMRRSMKEEPEIVTWGHVNQKTNEKIGSLARNTIEIQKQSQPAGFCSCCAPSSQPNSKEIQVQKL